MSEKPKSARRLEAERLIMEKAKEMREGKQEEYFPKYKELLNQVKDHLGPNAYKQVLFYATKFHWENIEKSL